MPVGRFAGKTVAVLVSMHADHRREVSTERLSNEKAIGEVSGNGAVNGGRNWGTVSTYRFTERIE